jgi:hypothetical protein
MWKDLTHITSTEREAAGQSSSGVTFGDGVRWVGMRKGVARLAFGLAGCRTGALGGGSAHAGSGAGRASADCRWCAQLGHDLELHNYHSARRLNH